MKVIKCLTKIMRKDLHHASEYAQEAIAYKDSNKTAADLFYQLATDRLAEVDKVHKAVTDIIKATDSAKIPAVMLQVWEFEHGMLIEEQAEIKAVLASYK